MSLFQRSPGPDEVAEAIWQQIRKAAADHAKLFDAIHVPPDTDVEEESLYFFAFVADLSLHLLENQRIEGATKVRNALLNLLRDFGRSHSCCPLPTGEWLGDSLIWLRGAAPEAHGDPIANLNQRFELYATAMKRRRDRAIGESLGHVLAAICGTTDISIIIANTATFLPTFEGVRDVVQSARL
jgi:hypothetical protein